MTDIKDPFWAEDFFILFKQDRLIEFFITEDQYISEKMNSVARFGIYSAIILALYHKDLKYLFLSLLVLLITFFIYKNLNKETRENLEQDIDSNQTGDVKKEYTMPTIKNPFGNTAVTDIIDNPKREPMADYTSYTEDALKVKEKVEDSFNHGLFRDVDDVYNRKNSQRQYYTTPNNGNIPPDPDGELKNWLYGNAPSCKDNTFDCGKTMFESPRFT